MPESERKTEIGIIDPYREGQLAVSRRQASGSTASKRSGSVTRRARKRLIRVECPFPLDEHGEHGVRRRLNEKEIDRACPQCGSLEERFGYFLLRRAARDWSPLISRDPDTRVVSATCGNCGSMRLFDANVLGL